MEFRDSGRDLVQIKDDGTHVILPATPHPMVRPDRAGLPVMMMLRHADGKMRRDAIHAASERLAGERHFVIIAHLHFASSFAFLQG
jgi:hypothetical protein